MLKKIICTILTAAMLLLCVGCNSLTKDDDDAAFVQRRWINLYVYTWRPDAVRQVSENKWKNVYSPVQDTAPREEKIGNADAYSLEVATEYCLGISYQSNGSSFAVFNGYPSEREIHFFYDESVMSISEYDIFYFGETMIYRFIGKREVALASVTVELLDRSGDYYLTERLTVSFRAPQATKE